MSNLLFGVLGLHILSFTINTIGSTVLNALVWSLLLKLPTETGRTARRHGELKKEVLRWKQQMTATSAQDEFAKWAKLRRKHDKALDEYEQINKILISLKVRFDLVFGTIRWLLTSGLKIFILFWYSKTPAFTLPLRWFPYPIEWLLAFPRAPTGTVSVNVWSSVCSTVVCQIGGAIIGLSTIHTAPAKGPVREDGAKAVEEEKMQGVATD
ncbi:GET complex subunit get1 [Ascosphaera aggregata]|nr:GET complex subunit get1 [Ascosphaera aggregata]